MTGMDQGMLSSLLRDAQHERDTALAEVARLREQLARPMFEDGMAHYLFKHALCGAIATLPDRPDAEVCPDCAALLATLPEKRECADTCAPHLSQHCSPECETAALDTR